MYIIRSQNLYVNYYICYICIVFSLFCDILFLSLIKIQPSKKDVNRMADFEPINFKRGFLPLIILSLLSQEDMYGYQLVQEIARQSEGKFLTKEGSLYPVLYKLLEGEFISSYEVKAGIRMRHIFYHIEAKGMEYLAFLKDQYIEVTSGIQSILDREEHKDE